MKKTKVINSDLSRVIATMGHFDKLVLVMLACQYKFNRKNHLAVDNGIPSLCKS